MYVSEFGCAPDVNGLTNYTDEQTQMTYRCLRRLSLGGSLVSAHPLFVLVKRPAPGHHGLEGLAYGRDVLLLLRALKTLERLEARVFLGVFIVDAAVHPALLILKS